MDDEYFAALKELSELAAAGTANLIVVCIEPTSPNEKYRYIIPVTTDKVSKVSTFKEKLTEAVAWEYISEWGTKEWRRVCL